MTRPPSDPESPNCYHCRHFRITHDPKWPYGCDYFGMKARALPSADVLRSSGRPCQAFEAKPPPPKRKPSNEPPPTLA